LYSCLDENPDASLNPHRGNQPETISVTANAVGDRKIALGYRSGTSCLRPSVCGRGNPGCSASFPICLECGYTMARHFRSGPRMYGDLLQVLSPFRGHGVPRLFLQPSPRSLGRFASDLGGVRRTRNILTEASFITETAFLKARTNSAMTGRGRGSGRLLEHGNRR
jgi:hypothetical protein